MNNTTTKRLEVNPGCKGTRKKDSPTWWGFVKKYLINKWNAIEVHNMEVDDAVNITRLQVKDSHIVAVDKDLLNLEGTHYNWVKNQWVTTNKENAEYEFWKDAVIGQTGDNVKGIPGVGKANKIFKEKLFKPTAQYVLGLYIDKLGEEEGIQAFYVNYHSLKIKDKDDAFTVPNISGLDVKEEKDKEW